MINLTEAQEYLDDIPDARIKSECPDLPEAIRLLREARSIIEEAIAQLEVCGSDQQLEQADQWLSEVQP
jgi:hypothetical protein